MRVFVAGATGALGARLVPQLVERGHEVIGTTRSAEKTDRLAALGAEPVVLDVLDPAAVRDAVRTASPDAIVHQATALAGASDVKHFDRSFELTNRLRTEGTDALLEAAREAGVGRFVAQSYAGLPYARTGGPVKTEEDPLDPSPVPDMRQTLRAIEHLEAAVAGEGGIALRYGGFYGSPDDAQLELVRKRQFPLVGDGAGVWSFVHLEDAASATVLAVERGDPGSTTWSTTSRLRCARGSPPSRLRSAPSRLGTSRAGWPVSWPARPPSC
jgi:nucleoside-diphosphate-sugar epimerase